MSTKSAETPKLSLVAQFDDMCRFANSLICVDEEELNQLIHKSEENRIKWFLAERELVLKENKIQDLEKEKNKTNSSLKKARFAFARELQNREELVKERDSLRNQLNAIKEFVQREPTSQQSHETLEKMLSYMNASRLETVIEASNESLDGVQYDKSDDEILDLDETFKGMSAQTNSDSREQNYSKNSLKSNLSFTESVGTVSNINQICDQITNGPQVNEQELKPNESEPNVSSERQIAIQSNSGAIPKVERSGLLRAVSMNSSNTRTSTMKTFRNSSPQDISRMIQTINIDKREHTFQQKKAFKPTSCGPCTKSIGFYGTFLICRDCRAIAHIQCKDQLPLPCIPYKPCNRKNSRMLLIADFAPQNTRPMIPALIIHCCHEIEKRGLHEEGLYRKCGADKEVRELKHKIVNSKTGIPVLAQYDIHVICGVIKQFLRDLDEPIVTRILWRDFVKATDQENPEQEKALIMQTVSELPMANRDSLAFLIIHLQRIAQSDNTLMDISSLAKVFGPAIVGYSMIDLPMTELLAENPKQIKVMEALLRIPEDYWSGIISTHDCGEGNEYGSPDRHKSGKRLSLHRTEPITPNENNCMPRTSTLTLKPLF